MDKLDILNDIIDLGTEISPSVVKYSYNKYKVYCLLGDTVWIWDLNRSDSGWVEYGKRGIQFPGNTVKYKFLIDKYDNQRSKSKDPYIKLSDDIYYSPEEYEYLIKSNEIWIEVYFGRMDVIEILTYKDLIWK